MTDIAPHKRNVIAISTALSIYYLGDVDIQSASTFFGSIKFNRPWIIELGAWAMFVYFIWQHWIRSRDFRANTKTGRLINLRKSKEFKDGTLARLEKENIRLTRPDRGSSEINKQKLVELINNVSGREGVSVGSRYSRKYFIIMINGLESSPVKQKARSFWLEYITVKRYILNMFSDPMFSDYDLPYMLAWITVAIAASSALCK